MMDMRVLNQAAPIEPIRTVEELVDVTASAVEHCDSPDTADRVSVESLDYVTNGPRISKP